ncbi:MAG: DUF2059 domain-containing protein [Nevskia sp.]
MRKLAATLMFAVAGFAGPSTAAFAALNAAQAEELLQKSGFNSQLAQIESSVLGGLNLAPDVAAKIGEADLQTIRSAFSTAFAADRLSADAREQMKGLLTPEVAKSALAWLDSDLGRRITALEDQAGKTEGFSERGEAAAELFKKLPERRIERYANLAKTLNAGEASASIVINTALATARGALSLSADAPEQKVAEIKAQLEQNRPKLVAQLNDEYVVLFAGAYRTLEDKELDQYLAFSGSPAGLAYNAALSKLLDVVMTHASLESGRLIAQAKRGKTGA